MADYNWEDQNLSQPDNKKVKRKLERRLKGPKKKKHRKYKASYNPTPLEELLSTRGEANAKYSALQRGKTVVTTNTNDTMRAQTTTAKTFNGIDILDNLISYDKNVVKEPLNKSMAAQFGNYQANCVMNEMRMARGGKNKLYTPCPI